MSLWDQEQLRAELQPLAQGYAGRVATIDQLFERCMQDLTDPRLRSGAASVLATCLSLDICPADDDPTSPSASVLTPRHEPLPITQFPISGKIIA